MEINRRATISGRAGSEAEAIRLKLITFTVEQWRGLNDRFAE